MISAVDLARVRAAADLVAIAGEHTQLKRVGRQWMATCPFHKEPTPSLSINTEEGLWWCFGCQQGGDAITFVQRIHHLEFVDAVEWLAARAGITLAPQSGAANPGTKTQLVAVTGQAAEWYHGQLLDNAEAQPARDYLAGRGVTRELLEDYQVGWAPAGWDNLVLDTAGGGRASIRRPTSSVAAPSIRLPLLPLNGGSGLGVSALCTPVWHPPLDSRSARASCAHTLRPLNTARLLALRWLRMGVPNAGNLPARSPEWPLIPPPPSRGDVSAVGTPTYQIPCRHLL